MFKLNLVVFSLKYSMETYVYLVFLNVLNVRYDSVREFRFNGFVLGAVNLIVNRLFMARFKVSLVLN